LEEQAKKRFIINVIFIGIWVGIIIFTGSFLLKYMFPFVLAVLVSALVQRPAEKISHKIPLKKGVIAAALSALLYVAVAASLGFLIFKVVIFAGDAVLSLGKEGAKSGEIFASLQNSLTDVFAKFSPEMEETFTKILQGFFAELTDDISRLLSSTVTSVIKMAPSVFFSSIVALAATCYIAKDYEGLKKFLNSILTEKRAKTVAKVKNIFKGCVLKMLSGYLILMTATFVELTVGFLILRVNNSVWLAIIIAFVDILPVLGVGTVLIPWGIINVILGNTVFGIGLMVLYLIITLIRNFAEPKIVGQKMGVDPLLILLCMFLGLKLFGFAGLVILPVTFIVVIKYYKSEMEKDTSHI